MCLPDDWGYPLSGKEKPARQITGLVNVIEKLSFVRDEKYPYSCQALSLNIFMFCCQFRRFLMLLQIAAA